MKKIAVSLHAIDDFNLNILQNIKDFDYIHVDVMDGKFVNNKNNNLEVFKILKETYETPIIAHLMVINPAQYVEKIIHFIDYFVFHFEIDFKIIDIIEKIRENNKNVGLAINPETKISKIQPYLNKIDLILVMSVNPGWSGQKFIPKTIKKIDQLAKLKNEYNYLIDIDGGINLTNAKLLKNTDILTSSSTILKAKNPNDIIQLLRKSTLDERKK
ncbi:MAG: ribulose-phosphate 3-epimerase [Promethearchaeota archaeon]